MSVLVIGAGGHGKVVADILQTKGVVVLGFLDDNPATWGTTVLGLPVFGAIELHASIPADGIAMGIGSNRARRQIVARFSSLGWINAIHPSATIAHSVSLGMGITIAPHVVLAPATHIGDFAIINTAATVDHDCSIGSYAHIAPGSHLAGGVSVGEGALLGVGTSVIPGCTIGAWSTVGAGAAVVKDIPPNTVAKGIPARWEG